MSVENSLVEYENPKSTVTFPSGKLFRISYSSLYNNLKLECRNSYDIGLITEAFSDTNPNAFFMRQYGYDVPQKVSVINQFGFFQPGLFFEVVKFIKTMFGSSDCIALSDEMKNYIVDYIVPLKKVLPKGGFEVSNISDDSGRNDELEKNGRERFNWRIYQKESVENLLFKGFGKGIVELGTAGGKSFIICNLVYNLLKNIDKGYRFLILVPTKQLVSQMYNDFLDYGFDGKIMSKLTAGLKKSERYNPEAKVIIANRQFVFTNKNLLPKIDCLFCDEIHTILAKNTQKLIAEINARLMFGCTGTMPKRKYDRQTLFGMFNSVVYSKPMTELQNEGYVTKIKLYSIQITDTNVENNRNYLFNLNPLKKYSPDENGYSEIAFNAAHDEEHEYYEKYYKELYTPALKEISKYDENTLILFDRIEFGKRLTELSHEIFKDRKIHYIDGSVPIDERLKITADFEKTGNNVLFAEFATFSTGVSIHRLTNLVFVSSSKSFPRICQSIGRTLRLYKGKDYARIFDISFNFKYSKRHYRERLQIYKEMYNKKPDSVLKLKI